MTTTDILFERRGTAGIVTLNRTKALNAVTHAMVRALAARLGEWAKDEAVTRVVVVAAGERAFSAGGGIPAPFDPGQAGRDAEAPQVSRDEDMPNTLSKRDPQTHIAPIHGAVIGGGARI